MEKKADFIWFNGQFVPWQDAKIHVMSHALHYGSSVFEGIRVYQGGDHAWVFRLTDHIQRLFNSAKIYRLHIPYTPAEVKQACLDVVMENNLNTGAYIRPLAFMGAVGAGIKPPSGAVCEMMIAAFPWGSYLGEKSLTEGVDVHVSSWQRLAPNTMPTAAKAGGHYLSSQLIAAEAKRHGYHEGIALDTQGFISEGSGENIFIVRNELLMTPPANSAILPGLTRDTVFTLAQKMGLATAEQILPREALYLADEVFMTGTAAEIVPVRSVDGITIGQGKAGEITQRLQQAFFGLFTGETPDYGSWLTPVM
ncbi:MAG: branched-chain amino acid transaminase [Shewanellaceae bacterium]|nr:branched-chain amino acid transaminase [Shewanellaceae bacterium]